MKIKKEGRLEEIDGTWGETLPIKIKFLEKMWTRSLYEFRRINSKDDDIGNYIGGRCCTNCECRKGKR